jgi:hypothetical protein
MIRTENPCVDGSIPPPGTRLRPSGYARQATSKAASVKHLRRINRFSDSPEIPSKYPCCMSGVAEGEAGCPKLCPRETHSIQLQPTGTKIERNCGAPFHCEFRCFVGVEQRITPPGSSSAGGLCSGGGSAENYMRARA